MSDLRSRAEAARDAIAATGTSGEIAARAVAEDAAKAAQVPSADVTESGIEPAVDVPAHVAWSRVMGEIQWIGKGEAPGLKYKFRGIDAIRNAVGAALRKHGVMVIPIRVRPEYTQVKTSGGSTMSLCRVVVNWAIIGPRGDRMPVDGESAGEAFDSGDKATSKATSVAERDFLATALSIPTDRPEMDPEHGPQHQLASPPRPTAEQYAAEILDDRTSVNRLQQIKAELDADPRMGHAEVEQLGGEKIELGRLVRRVGAKRLAAEKGAGQ